MSLSLAAQHIRSHGRGPDDQLVHMSTGEVKALRGLAQINGGDLTINPKTGLPEAGFLSSILPTVAGIAIGAMTGSPLLAAGIVGVADAAITGSIGQGLMAGLGAWSGAGLAGDIQNLAAAGTQVGSNVAEGASTLANTAAETIPNAAINTNIGMGGINGLTNTTGGIANIGQVGTQAAGAINPTGVLTAQDVYNASTASQAQSIANQIAPQAANQVAPQVAAQPSNWDKFTSGAQRLWDNPTTVGKELWNMPGAKMDIFGTAMPFVRGIAQEMQPDPYQAPKSEKNPFHLKYLSKDFQGTQPRQPSPYYQAQYRDYVVNPYIPGEVATAAGGGLQAVHGYSGLSDSLTAMSKELLKTPTPAPIGLSDPNAKYDPIYYEGDAGITANKWGRDYDSMSADQLATHILSTAKKLGKTTAKASVMQKDPAQTAISSIQNEQQESSAKEGGLQGYALGGLSMGHLGGYSDGGRLLKGPGDGVSDSIPASIDNKQPARLAEGEFVIPARIVSELGNGSTDAGAKRLYAMMDRIKAKRAKATNIAADTKTYNYLPA